MSTLWYSIYMKQNLKLYLEQRLGESIDSVVPIFGGEVNQTYLVTTLSQEFVARINSKDEFRRFQKEKWCIEQAAHLGVATSPVIDLGTYKNESFMLLEYIAGTSGMDFDNKKHTWQTIGRYAKLIHSIPVQGFGEGLDDITEGTANSWVKYIDDNLHSMTDPVQFYDQEIATAEQVEYLVDGFKELKSQTYKFGLSHGDMSLRNVIIDSSNCVHLIDWGAAEAYIVPHYDLGVILTDSLNEDSDEFREVLDGYGLGADQYQDIRDDIQTLMLLIAFDKVRWAMDRKPERLSSAKEHFHKMHEWKVSGILKH
jgi:aminoglycoside phosphotransferase (APT) family kinase protein